MLTGIWSWGPYRRWRERPVQEVGLVQEWRGEGCTGDGKESLLPVVYGERNWIGWGRTGEYENSTWFCWSRCILTQYWVNEVEQHCFSKQSTCLQKGLACIWQCKHVSIKICSSPPLMQTLWSKGLIFCSITSLSLVWFF
jgi:hypothetical protein